MEKKSGAGHGPQGANPSVLALTPPGHSNPCERFQACSPLRKPSMPKSTHTKQTHQGGPCTIKGFFALQEGSAHGKLKIGASPGVVKEALISEAPHTPHASDTFRKLATPTGLAGPRLPPGADISVGTSTAVLIGRVPLWAVGRRACHHLGDRLPAVLLNRAVLGHLERTRKPPFSTAGRDFMAARRGQMSKGSQCPFDVLTLLRVLSSLPQCQGTGEPGSASGNGKHLTPRRSTKGKWRSSSD